MESATTRRPSRSKMCCAPGAQARRAAAPFASPAFPATRTASGGVADPAGDERIGAQVFDTLHHGRHAAPERELDVLGPHAQRAARAVGRQHRGTVGSGDHGAARTGRERQQVHRRRADEAGDERVRRAFVEIDRRRGLLDPAAVQQHDLVGHRHRLDLIVRDVDHRDAQRALQVADLGAHVLPQLRIEIRQRLVHQADRRLGDDRPAERDALLLAAGELRRLAVEQLREPEEVGHARELAADIGARDLAHLQAEHDVLGHRQVREQRVRLEHHRDVALRRRAVRDILSRDGNASTVGLFEPGNQAQRGRLAAAGRTQQDVERAFVERKRQPVDRPHFAVGGRPVLAEIFGNDGRHEYPRSAAASPRQCMIAPAPRGAVRRTVSKAPRRGRRRA